MKYIVIAIISLTTFAAQALPRYDTEQYIRQLQGNGVDTIILYQSLSPGIVPSPGQNYIAESTDYVIWRVKGIDYIRRFDDCYRYKPRQIQPGFMQLITSRYNEFKKEELLPTKFRKKGFLYFFSSYSKHITHYGATRFTIYAPAGQWNKDIDGFNLDAKFDGEYRNVNYAENQRSIQNRLKIFAERATKNSVIFVSGVNGKLGVVNRKPQCKHFKRVN